MKKKPMNEAQLLDLLKRVLPKATHDAELARKIFLAVESELKAVVRVENFEKFCAKVELPNLEPKSIAEVKSQLNAAFGDADVTVKPDKKGQALLVEVDLPTGKISSQVKVRPLGPEGDEEQEIVFKFVAFPISLPGDPELVWVLGKREHLSPEEAGVALSKIEEDFWASKAGQKALRDRVDRSFAEFITRVPSGMLSELGLKRHYKLPEALRHHRTLEGAPDSRPKPKRAAKAGAAED